MLMYILRDEALDGKRSSTSSRTDSGSSIPARRRDCSMSSSTERDRARAARQRRASGIRYDEYGQILRHNASRSGKNGKIKTVATSCFDVLEENLSDMELVSDPSDRRLLLCGKIAYPSLFAFFDQNYSEGVVCSDIFLILYMCSIWDVFEERGDKP